MSRRDSIISALRTIAEATGEDIQIGGGSAKPSLADIEKTYGFPVDPSDQDAYLGGRLSYEELIARMDKRKA